MVSGLSRKNCKATFKNLQKSQILSPLYKCMKLKLYIYTYRNNGSHFFLIRPSEIAFVEKVVTPKSECYMETACLRSVCNVFFGPCPCAGSTFVSVIQLCKGPEQYISNLRRPTEQAYQAKLLSVRERYHSLTK